jgi:2-(1,2-epoxy-1,2-dihydrophenyl)acetyl-CoA isomerase
MPAATGSLIAMTIDVAIEGGLATVTLNRPDKKNAISMAMRQQLWEAFEDLSEDDAVRAVILTGAGGDFCSGMDVTEFGGGGVPGSMMRMRRLHRISRAIAGLKKPVIAAVQGVCMGAGWSYALACDLVVADDSARFAQVFRKIALSPDGGAVWLLRQHVGAMRAKEIVFSGRTLGADEALALGLILEKTLAGGALARARELATSLADGPTLALGMAKRQFDLAGNLGFDAFLDAEFSMQPVMSRTEDHEEGVRAFKERRPAVFKGH